MKSEMSDLKISFVEDYPNALNKFVHRKAPNEYGSPEDILAHSLYNRESLIILPEEDLIVPVVSFILNCPDIIWKQNNFPESFLLKRSILFPVSEVMGKEFAQIATGIFRYFGSLKVFEILRSSYAIDGNRLIRTLRFTRD